ncbi:UDP-glucose/GDP-mannose dehydrogenase family protein [Janthinobacterium sp. BJB1]|uniref:nucleotide sugar dehydrogenase n=1 Tax=Janthinobacterium sp. GW458P TaxID=1981504 RepID=UPI000A326B94|nr:UDP-glucose/GDP-mannose dehydrogenase family protein [Janthinobacterium sp. GW458P]MBE3028127.1 UDP-glucose/GDP-mannose dehydrogenase family protein [Janthinobacterium sp. GW458P]PHV17190.1 UDP-glucose/GDP-mannose dehydrogenase family protein [Janthinobacterium sp. BJB303]PJC96756.1 UDP-glucose/GDP-mannose dehydrogenase family protein [Janthinobacterium sp. BJB1]
MKISIFGLGYVGAVSAGCLATDGHEVIGVDPNKTKVDLINQGTTPIIEKDIGEMIAATVKSGHLRATADVRDAVFGSDMSLICVGTPSQLNGNLDLSHVRKVCQEIGAAIAEKDSFHVVVARSTMLPGSMRALVIPTLEAASGKVAGVDFGVCNNPEFLREGTAVYDYYHPPKTVIGESDEKAGALLVQLYEKMDAPLVRTDVETAEMVKYTDNTWHAVKVAFANEIGNICKAVGIDGHKVMEIFCQDTKLNLSPYYMKPGFAFGGSCLPKDVRALTYKARSLDLDLPLLNSILPSNQRQVEKGIKMIVDKGARKVGILGFSFKAGTDDLRESPLVDVIEYLLGKGYELKLYDKNVNLAALTGANQDYILNHIPHISKLMVTNMQDVLDFADTIVIGNGAAEFKTVPASLQPHQHIVDLVRISKEQSGEQYDGICW